MAAPKPSARLPSLAQLVEPLREALALRGPAPDRRATAPTVGFFNPVHPPAIQVIGDAGAHYLAGLPDRERARLPSQLARKGLKLTIATEGADPTPWNGLTSDRPAHEVVYALRAALIDAQTVRKTLHGVLVDVHGIGALILGAPGVGKGLLALDLLARGHALVADDAVELARPADGVLLGAAPKMLRGYMEVRDLGVLDVAKMHGRTAVKARARVQLVVSLVEKKGPKPKPSARLEGRRGRRAVLGVTLPSLSLPAHSGHNLAPLVEAACLDRRMRLDGADPVETLVRRQARAIEQGQ